MDCDKTVWFLENHMTSNCLIKTYKAVTCHITLKISILYKITLIPFSFLFNYQMRYNQYLATKAHHRLRNIVDDFCLTHVKSFYLGTTASCILNFILLFSPFTFLNTILNIIIILLYIDYCVRWITMLIIRPWMS